MTLTIDVPDDLAAALADGAARVGQSVPDYVAGLLAAARPAPPAVRTGADLVACWQAEGLIGSCPAAPGEPDAPDTARLLRGNA